VRGVRSVANSGMWMFSCTAGRAGEHRRNRFCGNILFGGSSTAKGSPRKNSRAAAAGVFTVLEVIVRERYGALVEDAHPALLHKLVFSLAWLDLTCHSWASML
jgi:hypothetical protein